MAVDKQILAMRLHETQAAYEKLRRHAMEQRKRFTNKTNQMQYEIDEVKNSLAATKVIVAVLIGTLFQGISSETFL